MRLLQIIFLLNVLALIPLFALANQTPVSNPGGPYLGATAKPILFNGSASSDADKDLLTYAWDFGDGTLGSTAKPSHSYTATGIYTVTLVVNDGVADSMQRSTTATISLRPPSNLNLKPESGAPFIDFPLQLDWENVPAAQSYRYELIEYQENGGPKEFLAAQSKSDPLSPAVLGFLEPQHPITWYQELNKCDKNGDGKCTDSEVRTFIKDQQKHLWHVKSCEDAEGIKCGPWSAIWDFTYLLGPATLKIPPANASNVSLPLALDWDDMPGAESYNLMPSPCPSWMQDSNGDCYSIPISPKDTTLLSEYKDDVCLFTKKSTYEWKVVSCLDEKAFFCTNPDDFSSQSFNTSISAPPILAPKLLQPLVKTDAPPKTSSPAENIPSVSKTAALRWSGDSCAYFYRVNIFNEAGTRITEDNCLSSGSACTFNPTEINIGDEALLLEKIQRLWDQPSDLDKTYSWSVTPCWSSMLLGIFPIPDCTNTTDSERWYFHTAGKTPTLTAPLNNASTKIPISLSWQGDGSSYRYQVAKNAEFTQIAKEGTVQKTSAEIAYAPPNIVPGTSYWWRVKTCVDENATTCGLWSATFKFSTFPFEAPSILPDGGQVFLTDAITWDSVSGANFYQYNLGYACRDEKETLQNCTAYNTNVCPNTSATRTVKNAKIVSTNTFFLPYCTGMYTFAVRSCLDKDCTVATPSTLASATHQTLTAIQPPPSGVGLVPCGKLSNEPATPYNEVEPCQLKHAGFLLQNLLDFILWKISLFVLLILAVTTGATSYFSLGGPNGLARIKTVFRSFFAGFLMLVFAWMLINIILMLLGFKFQFFGRWWELSF